MGDVVIKQCQNQSHPTCYKFWYVSFMPLDTDKFKSRKNGLLCQRHKLYLTEVLVDKVSPSDQNNHRYYQ